MSRKRYDNQFVQLVNLGVIIWMAPKLKNSFQNLNVHLNVLVVIIMIEFLSLLHLSSLCFMVSD